MPAADRRDHRRHSGSAAAPSGLGVVVAFYTWGSRPRLYDVAPSGLDAWAAVAHADLLLPFGAGSVPDRGLLRSNHASPAPKGRKRTAWGVSPRFPGIPT